MKPQFPCCGAAVNQFRRWLILLILGFAVAHPFATSTANAETAAVVAAQSQHAIDSDHLPAWWTPNLPDNVQRDVQQKGQRHAAKLELNDASKSEAAASLIAIHFARVWAWHQQVDERLDAAWADWDAARSNVGGKEKDELKALAIMTEQIDPIYAQFTPQIQTLLRELHKEIGEEKTTELLDNITRSPGAKRTYNAYLGIVPEMTIRQKEILWSRMVQAREDSLAAWSNKRIIKIFKKYKVRNEFSIDYFGYGYRKRYEAWSKRQR